MNNFLFKIIKSKMCLYYVQDRQIHSGIGATSNALDNLRYPLEQQLIEIMRNSGGDNQDHYKGELNDLNKTMFYYYSFG